MLIATLPVTDYAAATQHIFQLADRADGIELRLDYLAHWDMTALAVLRQACKVPVIMTLRSRAQGGHYPHAESQRIQALMALCALNPDYLDVEYDVPAAHRQAIRQCYPAIKIILSYHNFQETPVDLPALFETIYQPDCYAYKIVTLAHSSVDALRMLHCVLTHQHRYRIIGFCMGEAGQLTRILSPIVGNLLCYAYWDPNHAVAPGQLSIQDLLTIYDYRRLNAATQVLALLGDPIDKSVGHILHNRAFAVLHQNAVYVKLRVLPEELSAVLDWVKRLPFMGLSITMPIKEDVMPLLDEIDATARSIGAVNTIVRQHNRYLGLNTDGLGAMQALAAHTPISGQTILVVGAGGAARAIAYEALRQHSKVMIVNRTLATAQRLADDLGCEAYALDALPTLTYTVCINTLPESAYQSPNMVALWQPSHLLPNIIAMDIVYQPIETAFLRLAKVAGWYCIPGFTMFIAQALLQLHHWFQPEAAQIQEIHALMQQFFMQRR